MLQAMNEEKVQKKKGASLPSIGELGHKYTIVSATFPMISYHSYFDIFQVVE